MKTQFDKRCPLAGFVMVNVGTSRERRMIYAPEKGNENRLVLSLSNWGPLNKGEIVACRDALIAEFPDHEVVLR